VHYRGRLFRDVQREIYQRVLDSCGGNCAAAAAALGVPKSTFFDHVRTMKLRR
jgi:transcriptional regulator of acetoin/glycerol metabolism